MFFSTPLINSPPPPSSVEDIYRGERRITSSDVISDDCDSLLRWGMYAFEGGFVYTGYWRDGVMSGWGTMFGSASIYEGEIIWVVVRLGFFWCDDFCVGVFIFE
jgi:hypothetical protein